MLQEELIKAMDAKDYGKVEELFANGARVTDVELAHAKKSGDEQLISLFSQLKPIHDATQKYDLLGHITGVLGFLGKAIGDGVVKPVPFPENSSPCQKHAEELHNPNPTDPVDV